MSNENAITEQGKTIRAEYYRKWRAKNKAKVKTYNERYWERRAKKMLESNQV